MTNLLRPSDKLHRAQSTKDWSSETGNPYSSQIAAARARAAASSINLPRNVVARELADAAADRSIDERLFDSLAACKIKTREVVMHFDGDWQKRFFHQLDQLMDKEEWDGSDVPITLPSFTTLIRLLLTLRGKRRPGVGIANHGNIVASWSAGPRDRLTIECHPEDRIHWIVSRPLDGEVESAAGVTSLERLFDVLQAYNPDHWFTHEGSKSPA